MFALNRGEEYSWNCRNEFFKDSACEGECNGRKQNGVLQCYRHSKTTRR